MRRRASIDHVVELGRDTPEAAVAAVTEGLEVEADVHTELRDPGRPGQLWAVTATFTGGRRDLRRVRRRARARLRD